MCPLPDFGSGNPSPAGLLDAVAAEIDSASRKPDMLSLYNDGSYYAPSEFVPELRRDLERLVRDHDISLFNIETLPCFFDPRAIEETRERTAAQVLVSVGVQSFDPDVRRHCIGSPFSQRHLDRMLNAVQRRSLLIRIYLLFKAPFLSEWEAMEDLGGSLAAGLASGAAIISVNPCKVARGTVLEHVHRHALYRPPHLHSIAKVLGDVDRRDGDARISVEMPYYGGCPGDIALPHQCDLCAHLAHVLPHGQSPTSGDPACWSQHMKLEPTGAWKGRREKFLGLLIGTGRGRAS